MVVIRLSRGGSKKRPFYSIQVADQRRSLRGRFIEKVGFYNPIASSKEVLLRLDTARIEHWMRHGAQPSARVSQLYAKAKKGGHDNVIDVAQSAENVADADADKSGNSGKKGKLSLRDKTAKADEADKGGKSDKSKSAASKSAGA